MAYAKYHLYKQQISHDGYTWEDTGIEVASGEVISIYDTLEECRGITPSSFEGKIKLTYNSGQTYSAECDSTSAVTYADTNIYTPSAMTSAIVGNCVTQILHGPTRHSPFRQCSGLTSVLLPSSLRFIDDYSFAWCVSLTGITIPSGVTSIGTNEILHDGGGDERGAFFDCRSLVDVYIPNTVTTIGKCAFMKCSGLTSIDIPDSVTTIGAECFWDCSSLTSINIPNGVTYIDNYTFRNCSSLTNITIPNRVTSIGDYAFQDCTSLTSIDIPSSVSTIKRRAFQNCSGLINVTIGDGITEIGYGAFYGCTSLTSITVNATTPPTLGGSAFSNTNNCPIYVPCASVDAYKSATNWSTYASRIQGIPPCGQPTFERKYKLTLSNSSTVSAECDSTSAITRSEVSTPYESTLVSAEIGDCVNTIDAYAFYGCGYLTSVAIPDSVTSIGYGAFWACGLTSIDIPNSVKTIGDKAFTWCSRLTSVDIPSGVTSIGDYAFEQCYNLTSVTVNATTPPTLGVFAFRATNSCPIYVPAASVNAYKSATNWSDYSSRIQAIP